MNYKSRILNPESLRRSGQEILIPEYQSFVFEEFCLGAFFWHGAESIDFTGISVFLARFGISFESSIATLNI